MFTNLFCARNKIANNAVCLDYFKVTDLVRYKRTSVLPYNLIDIQHIHKNKETFPTNILLKLDLLLAHNLIGMGKKCSKGKSADCLSILT